MLRKFSKTYLKSKFLHVALALSVLSAGQVVAGDPIDRNSPDVVPHMLGLYLSQKGLAPFENNFDKILELNGISTTGYSIPEYRKKMEPTKFNDLIPDNKKLHDVAAKVRYYFNKFFEGFRIRNTHQFEFEVDGIELSGAWKKFGFKILNSIVSPDESEQGINALVEIQASELKFYVDKIRARDYKHKFIGDIGVDGFYIELKEGDMTPLTVRIPLNIFVKSNGGLRVEVGSIEENILQLKLKGGVKTPMTLPRIEIRINGRRAWLRLDEVEHLLKAQLPKVVQGLQEAGHKFLNENVQAIANEKINELTGKGFTEVNEMAPLGLEDGKVDTNYIWGLSIDKFEYMDRSILHAGLLGFVKDPKVQNSVLTPADFMAKAEPLLATFKDEQFDLAISLNQGFLNRMLLLGFKRNYFAKMKTSGGETLQLVRTPKLDFINKGNGKSPTLAIRTKYTVTGWQKIFVRNPIEISVDLLVQFIKTADGKNKMVVMGADYNRASIENKYIKLFKKKVRSEVKKKLKGISKSIQGMVLSEDLPLPPQIGGIKVKVSKTKVDPNGHLIVFLDYDI